MDQEDRLGADTATLDDAEPLYRLVNLNSQRQKITPLTRELVANSSLKRTWREVEHLTWLEFRSISSACPVALPHRCGSPGFGRPSTLPPGNPARRSVSCPAIAPIWHENVEADYTQRNPTDWQVQSPRISV